MATTYSPVMPSQFAVVARGIEKSYGDLSVVNCIDLIV
ncbi:hypothetical protein EDC48_103132 [Gibbsiella quercinecans]|nr:hypothetical protein EDC48_103132 [Gibbsiella quercinecans]